MQRLPVGRKDRPCIALRLAQKLQCHPKRLRWWLSRTWPACHHPGGGGGGDNDSKEMQTCTHEQKLIMSCSEALLPLSFVLLFKSSAYDTLINGLMWRFPSSSGIIIDFRLSLLSLRKRNTAVIPSTTKLYCPVTEYSNLSYNLCTNWDKFKIIKTWDVWR